MDTTHHADTQLRAEKDKRSLKYLRFKLQPGDRELFDLLPAPQRELIEAEGSYMELARRFNLPIGTVRSRLHRARAALEKLRESHGDGQPEHDSENPPASGRSPIRHQ
jgi:DNA-directed RNA polymerase specialized sigma24 family protein